MGAVRPLRIVFLPAEGQPREFSHQSSATSQALLGGPPAPQNATNTLSGCSLPVCPAPKVQPQACGAVWQVQPNDTCAKIS